MRIQKLYDLQKGQLFKIYDVENDFLIPYIYKFMKIDGIYCLCLDEIGNIVHIKAYTSVVMIEE